MLIDTNIIIYAINNASPKHDQAKHFLTKEQYNLVVADQNILEALRVLTHTKFSHPMTFFQAEKAVNAIAESTAIVSPTYETLPIAIALMYKSLFGKLILFGQVNSSQHNTHHRQMHQSLL